MVLEEMLRKERKEGFQEGRQEGIQIGFQKGILMLLLKKNLPVGKIEHLIVAQKDTEILQKWLLLAGTVSTQEDFLQEIEKDISTPSGTQPAND